MGKIYLFLLVLIISYSCNNNGETKKLDGVLNEVIKDSGVMIALKTSSKGNNTTLILTVQSAVKNEFTYGKILLSFFEKLRAKYIVYEEYIINDGKSNKIVCSVEFMNHASNKMKLYKSHLELLNEKKFSAFYGKLSPELQEAFINPELKTKFEALDYNEMETFEGLVFLNEKNIDYIMFANSHESNDIRLSYDLSPTANSIIGIQMH